MTQWDRWLSHFLQLVREAVYPPDAENRIEAGRAAFLRLDTNARYQAALNARVPLRLMASFARDAATMRRLAEAPYQDPAMLFCLDDLLRRYPACLGLRVPTDPPDAATIPVMQALAMLHLLQYDAEMEQDVLVGYRAPR